MGFSRQKYWSGVPLLSLHLLFHHFQFALIHGPDVPGSYAILLFTASYLASITSHIHSWVFLLWLHPFILSGYFSTDLQAAETPSALSVDERSYPTSEVRGRSQEDPMPEGRQPRGVTPRPRSGAVAENARLQRRRNGREELPRVRGQGHQPRVPG